MMAHELPVSIHSESKPCNDLPKNKKKTQKSKGQSQEKLQQTKSLTPPVRLLPNGEAVDFGGGSSKKNSKKPNQNSRAGTPSLPDGSAPNFKPNDSKSKGKKTNEKSKKEQSLPDGSKPNFRPGGSPPANKSNFNDHNNSSDKAKKNSKLASKSKPLEDTYAGSSFHSSPAALNLPKPSFKSTSPKADQVVGAHQVGSPLQQGMVSPSQVPVGLPPQHQPLIHGQVPPPNLNYPVTLYGRPTYPPVGPMPVTQPVIYAGNQFVQNGFSYQHTPQGNINYQFAPGGQYPPAFPQQHFQQVPPSFHQQMPPPLGVSVPQNGQKISFNDLVGSSAK